MESALLFFFFLYLSVLLLPITSYFSFLLGILYGSVGIWNLENKYLQISTHLNYSTPNTQTNDKSPKRKPATGTPRQICTPNEGYSKTYPLIHNLPCPEGDNDTFPFTLSCRPHVTYRYQAPPPRLTNLLYRRYKSPRAPRHCLFQARTRPFSNFNHHKFFFF
jgi:hypothetical protein